MINLEFSILQIEELLKQNTHSSLTYAALECRLAIEQICYERLRLSHDYISHDDLKKWQPRDIVNTLIQEVDSHAAETLTISISTESRPHGSSPPTLEEYQEMEFVPIGTQVGFDPKKLGMLWNALANLALHVTIPISKEHEVCRYGDAKKIKAKVEEALDEVKRIGKGSLNSSGLGQEISFDCDCGSKNKRRLELLKHGQVISCINPSCNESYEFDKEDRSFTKRVFEIKCKLCDAHNYLPKKALEKMPINQSVSIDCHGCGEDICISWRLVQMQKSKPDP